eukprot:scaffold102690_cov46-Attheya_sp.AAC.1
MSGAMMAFLVMTVAILFCQVCSYCDAVAPSSSLAFFPKARVMHNTARLFELRGGDDDDDMSGDEYDLDASSEEVEEEEPVVVALKKKIKTSRKKSHAKQSKLSESTKAATKKSTAKKTAESKQAVSITMSMTNKSKSKKKSSSSMIRIPYILKACLNPLTVFAMTRAYFASLFNIHYLEQDSSQTLRSALQEKAKQNDGASKKRKRAMKPGQAKTLSDLPQLSA